MAKFATLYSGSSGNCAVVSQGEEFIIIDMGGSCKATLGGLVALGLSPRNLQGILITHEHIDHVRGLMVFLKKVKVPILATPATHYALEQASALPQDAQLVEVDEESRVELGCFALQNFATSHDATGSCGWFISVKNGPSMAFATDLGCVTKQIFEHMAKASLVAIEANYDPQMLKNGPYPYYLKNRIASPNGHLSNKDCGAVVAQLVANGCRRVALCHLSRENNTPHHASLAVEHALLEHGIVMPKDCQIKVAHRSQPSQWMEF